MHDFKRLERVEISPWSCEYDIVDESWLFRLLHFRPKKRKLLKTPILIAYAYINRPYILDLHERVSVVRKMLEAGLDVWMIDWGYPKRADRYYQIDDYVDYIDSCIGIIAEKRKVEKVTLHGYCLGATLSTIYTSLNQRNVRNLVVQAPPINFDTDNTLAIWAKNIDPGKVVRAMGNAGGDFLNFAFLLVDPIRLTDGKYQALLDRLDDEGFVHDFLYMDHWIFDSPAIPGGIYQEYITRWYQRNEVILGKFQMDGRKVDLKKITVPTLLLVADRDHITPPECAVPFYEMIPSQDKLLLRVNKGHIGLTVSSSAHRTLWDTAIKWIAERSR